jgi:hypothetical protein
MNYVYGSGNIALIWDGIKYLPACSVCFTLTGGTLDIHCTGGKVSPRWVWTLWQKDKSLPSPGIETWFSSRPFRNLVTALTELSCSPLYTAEMLISGIDSACTLGMNGFQASGQRSSWKAASRPAGQQIPRLLFNSKRPSPCSQQPFIRPKDPVHLLHSLYLRYSLIFFMGWNSGGLDGRGLGVRFPAVERDFSLLHSVQTGSGAHLPS